MKVRLLQNRVLLKQPEGGVTQTQSGLMIAESKGERTEAVALKFTVVAIDPKVKLVKVGQMVHVNKWEVVWTKVDGIQYALAPESEIVLIEE